MTVTSVDYLKDKDVFKQEDIDSTRKVHRKSEHHIIIRKKVQYFSTESSIKKSAKKPN